MGIDYLYPEYEVVRNPSRCIACRVCERQCANEVHSYREKENVMVADDSKCVNCHRCVSLCPTHALKIVKSDHTFKINANWTGEVISEVYRQAGSGGVLLSSMGNPKNYPVYWDKILLNASQVTNPSIDPLREPMETRVFLGKKPQKVEWDQEGNIIPNLAPHLELQVAPSAIMLTRAKPVPPKPWVPIIIPVKADFMRISINTVLTLLFRWPPAASAYIRITSRQAPPSKLRWAKVPSQESADTFPA